MANIYIGILLARLETPWARSLKEKRSIVTPITERAKQRFPVSVARLDGLNRHDWEIIGVSAISHDHLWLEKLLRNVEAFIASQGSAHVAHSHVEIDVWADTDSWAP